MVYCNKQRLSMWREILLNYWNPQKIKKNILKPHGLSTFFTLLTRDFNGTDWWWRFDSITPSFTTHNQVWSASWQNNDSRTRKVLIANLTSCGRKGKDYRRQIKGCFPQSSFRGLRRKQASSLQLAESCFIIEEPTMMFTETKPSEAS